MKKINYITLLIVIVLSSCQEFLDEKPSMALVVPTTLADYQGFLDATPLGMNSAPNFGVISADDLTITGSGLFSLTEAEQNLYRWKSQIFPETEKSFDWIECYKQILNSNIVLDGLKDFTPQGLEESREMQETIGRAHFYRANAYYNLLQLFADSYDPNTSSTVLGLPIRKTSNINESSVRPLLEDNYNFLIQDLIEAEKLMSEKSSILTRPSKWAASALLSKVFLLMGRYEEALEFAEKCLEIDGSLMNYAHLDPLSPYPIPLFNSEVIFHSEVLLSMYMIFSSTTLVADDLYQSYDDADLRKQIYFTESTSGNGTNFKGNYTGSIQLFGGLSTNEIYLIKAECLTRMGRAGEGGATLDQLLETRYQEGAYEPVSYQNDDALLSTILLERRKELLFRNVRWSDLRRLNKEQRFAKTLKREIDGEEYMLPPNDPKYTLPLPPDEIRLSNLEQNPR
ncbi:RagB/SusD family nutrient uptake outer membrane protein [Litoribacter populi]|uniref:RagB/SusD family nutrient uptake outer membrane protein n=1 Tax=Litoribacter populi TaxID=2598460 RepID=UPI00163DE0AD|nr:RagB/SusD family nutrient uptake outer membrane protein [Litoribacter populi]